ncbi:hypothetical protein TanjilG_09978 [Lupinus angustifolius]|uniref:Uncharacterized protein n=1 Tax=Lupinus angustifolius TaxID=3871 RepID=A0A1J7GRW4_LUPAN|nr:PREDICTED: uncharacterized protein LOC109334235 [Lupinus angustifolius]OIV92380.1 hypothetical protein TanjilG_09978 [Lupinus angustifolius]
MRKEGNKQSKFKHYIFTPIRILKGVTACAGGFAGCGAFAGSDADDGVVQISHLNSSRANGDERHREILRTMITLKAANKTAEINYCMVQNNIVNNSMTSSTFKHVSCCCPKHGSGPCNNFSEPKAAMHGERTMPIRNSVGSQTRMVMHGEKVLKIRNNNNVGKETMVVMHGHGQRQPNYAGYKYNRKKMSYHSDGVNKMERIDEDKPCSFEQDQNDFNNAHLLYLYPRTRTNTSSGKR